MRLSCAGRTDTGLRRSANEDSFCVREDLGLFVVADGMGGHVAGEIASKLVVDETVQFVAGTTITAASDTWPVPFDRKLGRNGNRLKAGLLEANRRINARINDDSALQGMATTAVAVLVDEIPGALAHVGDSRGYLVRDGRIEQLTEDHSLVNERLKAGLITEEEAKNHKLKNIITRSLGFLEDVEIDLQVRAIRRGDLFVLCSDGLSNLVETGEIGEAVLDGGPQSASRTLIETACERGGDDNITVVVVRIDEAH